MEDYEVFACFCVYIWIHNEKCWRRRQGSRKNIIQNKTKQKMHPFCRRSLMKTHLYHQLRSSPSAIQMSIGATYAMINEWHHRAKKQWNHIFFFQQHKWNCRIVISNIYHYPCFCLLKGTKSGFGNIYTFVPGLLSNRSKTKSHEIYI